MKRFFIAGAAVVLSVILSGCAVCQKTCESKNSSADQLQIGWAKRSIAVPGQAMITGQAFLRVSLGEYSPVLVSALAISNSKDAAVFVSVDVVSVQLAMYKNVCEILKKEAPEIPVEKIIINATHSHTGPSTYASDPKYPNKVDIVSAKKSMNFISRQIVDAIKEAWAKRAPGSIAYGYGLATVGFSRRTVYLDDTSKRFGHNPGYAINGHCIMYGNTNDDKFAGYEAGSDPFINIMYTFDAKGKLNGAIVNVPCPAQNLEGAWMYYAGFWANVRSKAEAKYGDIGLICQSAAAGDLSPRQMHYRKAEFRRYVLKYPELYEEYKKNPVKYPGNSRKRLGDIDAEFVELMRAEDAAGRIMNAFDEVLEWASKEKQSSPVFKHEIKTVKLDRWKMDAEIVKREKEYHKKFMNEKFMTDGDPWQMLINNSRLNARRSKVNGVIRRYNNEKMKPYFETDIHVVRLGDAAFATNRFELYIDFMHRIQGRSPFTQTFIVQLVTDKGGAGSYLATERSEKNKGYGASPYSCSVSAKGGQQLVDQTVEMLKNIRK